MNIALLSGSIRTGSINTQLVHAMAQKFEAAGDSVTVISLADYEMPIYNGDYEAEHGAPQTTQDLATLLAAQDGIFICSPEYNGSLSALLKNTIDWLTRIGDRGHMHGPIWAIGSAAMGPMSGIMVMRQMQYILNRLLCESVPLQMGLGHSASAFNADGSFAQAQDSERADQQIAKLHELIARKKAYLASL